ncbi:fucolectin-1-like [Mercenaria mercenaria]|uniref:fucolectin-1-like n=1 Tax=Mercenaria mercenaria TaxID=6596 RepID=UPI00234ED8B5|nr:fucolectin-1-like [Mercenaria mercenaria]
MLGKHKGICLLCFYLLFSKLRAKETSTKFNHALDSGTCLRSIPCISFLDCFKRFENNSENFNVMVYERRYLLCKLCFVCKTLGVRKQQPGSILVHFPITDTSLENLARGKPSNQSSTYYGARGYATSSIAVDGIWESNMMAAGYSSYMCAHTKSENNIWWMVNLERIHTVSKVAILNRRNCNNCWLRLKNLTITVGETESNMQLCATYEGPGGEGELVNIMCQNSLLGQFVRISKPGPEFLQLCEVGVYC